MRPILGAPASTQYFGCECGSSATRSLVCLISPVDNIRFLVRETQNLGYECGMSKIVRNSFSCVFD